MPISELPAHIEELTAQCIDDRLHARGHLTTECVTSLRVEPLQTEGIGFLSALARLHITYDRPVDLPRTMIVKAEIENPACRKFVDSFHGFQREIWFFENIAPHSPIRLPRVFDTHFVEDAPMLLMEDLGGGIQGDQVAGLDPQHVRATIENIARFHARWWGLRDPLLANAEPWLSRPFTDFVEAYRAAWPGYLELHAETLRGRGWDRLGAEIGERFPEFAGVEVGGPLTLVHFDLRADNLLFDVPDTGTRAIMLDWQQIHAASGSFDFARLVAGSLSSDHRRQLAGELFELWHGTLLEGGVADYSREQAWHEVRLAVGLCMIIAVGHEQLRRSSGNRRALALSDVMRERFFSAAEELDSLGALSDLQ